MNCKKKNTFFGNAIEISKPILGKTFAKKMCSKSGVIISHIGTTSLTLYWKTEICLGLAPVLRCLLRHFMLLFYWPISRGRSPKFRKPLEFCLGLSLVTRCWQQPSLNLSHSATKEHRFWATTKDISTILLRWSCSVWNSLNRTVNTIHNDKKVAKVSK